MSKRVIVADDSLTIQKVVKISLQNHDFQLVEAKSLAELDAEISSKADLLLYDIGLTEDLSKFESILKKNGDLPVLVMLGAFDSYEKSDSITNHLDIISKPFESQKLIAKIESLLNNSELSSEDKDFQDEEFSGWGVSSNAESDVVDDDQAEQEDVETSSPSLPNKPLENELKGWGMEVPDVIEKEEPLEESLSELPPIIDNESEPLELVDLPDLDNSLMPKKDDLEYPDLIDLEIPADEIDETDVKEEPVSKLTSISELNDVDDTDEVPLSIEPVSVPSGYSLKLEQEIDADINPSEFWAEDGSVESLEDEFQDVPDDVEQELAPAATSLDEQSIRAIVRETVESICSELVEKIAWDVIPDLAENLIKKELKNISDKILDQEK